VITELNMATSVVKTSNWWLDYGATIHIWKKKKHGLRLIKN
jgi:hypothetical protein